MKKLNALLALLLAGAMTLGVGLTGCNKKDGGTQNEGSGSDDTGNSSDDTGNGSDDTGNGSDDNQTVSEEFNYSAANYESAAFEWNDSNAKNATVEYKDAGTADSNYVRVDLPLIRQIDTTQARVDVLGLQGGRSYDFKVTSSSGSLLTATNVRVNAYDRSGYAHFKYTSGVGAYNDDGSLKNNALVIYVSEANKNDITDYCYVNGVKTDITQYLWKKDGVTQKSIGYLLNNRAYSSNADRENYGIQKLSAIYSGVAVRILDEVTATRDGKGYYSIEGLTNYAKSGEKNPETGEQYKKGVSVPNGGTVGDNGGMVRIMNAKNLTIEGIGEEAMIHGWGIHFISNDNLHKYSGAGKSFEVRNITFYEYPEDAIGMEGTQGLKVDASGSITSGASSDTAEIISSVERCWIHNNTFLPGHCENPAESDKAEGDGSCDFKRGQYFTCSYNWFEYCHKTNLVGSSDASQQYNLTYHHNVWYQCGSRIPLTRQANVHFYNNYVWGDTTEKTTPYEWISKPAPSYIHSLRATCYIFSEANYYDGCKNVVDGTGGVAKGWKNVYFSCYGGSIVTEASSRVQKVENNCCYTFGKIDYSSFDTDPALFYYDTGFKQSKCYLTDAVTARVECLTYSGVLKHKYEKSGYDMTEERPDTAVTLGSDALTVDLSKATLGGTVSGVKFINAKNNSGAAKGKGLLAVFTLTERADITLSGGTTGDAAIELLNVNGKVIANKITSFTGTLEAGTYMITAGQKEKDGSITALSFKSGITDAERVQNVINYVNDIGDITLTADCAERIQFAQSAYNALSESLKAQVTNSGVLASAVNNYNALAAAKVIDLIDAIGTVNADSGVKISAAMTAYGNLTVSQQALVTNYQTLLNAQLNYSQFEVQGVQNAIDSLAAASSATTEDEVQELLEKYLTVKNMYEDLDEEKKPEVTGYDKVTNGIKSLEGAVKVYDTIALIDALPAAGSVTKENSAQIKAARAAYNSLDNTQKAGVTNLAKLTAAEEALKELIGEVAVVIFADSDTLAAGGVSLTGDKKNYKDMSFEYDGKTYDKALKLEDKTEVTIVLTEKSVVTIKLSGSGKAINYDGKNKASSGSDGTLTLTLEAGTHTITKNNPTEILYMEIVAA